MGAVDGVVVTSFACDERGNVRIATVAVAAALGFVDVLPNDIEDAWWKIKITLRFKKAPLMNRMEINSSI